MGRFVVFARLSGVCDVMGSLGIRLLFVYYSERKCMVGYNNI